MMSTWSRRQWISAAGTGLVANALGGFNLKAWGEVGEQLHVEQAVKQGREVIFFTSRGRIGVIEPTGIGEHYFEFDVPNQSTWHFRVPFPDGRRMILSSHPPGGSHAWLYELDSRQLTEIKGASAMGIVALMPRAERFLVAGPVAGETQIFTMALDGGDRQLLHRTPGFAYCHRLSPDATRVAYHITNVPGRPGYEIYVLDLTSRELTLLASDPNYLNFGPFWSPDGQWVVYQRCAYRTDPGHDHADVCISRADGSEQRILTTGQRHWFGTSYGSPETRGGGSNMPQWSPDGRRITYTRCLPEARTAWEYQADRPDTDHWNRDYKPELAQGGTQICLIDPHTGDITAITPEDPPLWNWRTEWSDDVKHLAFARAAVGAPAELWVMEADGKNPRFLTRGGDGKGVDFPNWVRLAPGISFS